MLTSYMSAAIGFLVGNAGPLALRIASSVEVVAAIILYWLGLRRAFDRGTFALAVNERTPRLTPMRARAE